MNKKGQGLTLNTIVIAILVVLVLVVVAAFFLGGTKGLTDSIKRVFFKTTTGTDYPIVIETCKQRCDQIDTTLSIITGTDAEIKQKRADAILGSAFCKDPFNIDKNSDGNVDTNTAGKIINYYCGDAPGSGDATGVALTIPCKYSCAAPA